MILSPFDVTRGLWEAEISSGALGSSGALPRQQLEENAHAFDRESLVLFRVHHSLCDGVSLSFALGDLADESEQLKETIAQETRKKRYPKTARKSLLSKIIYQLIFVLWYLIACLTALLHQLWRIATAVSPFDKVISNSKLPNKRSLAWEHLGPLEEVKSVSKLISNSATVNDLTVHLVAYAIRRQLDEHNNNEKVHEVISNQNPETVNIVIPVHLNGGMLRGGETIGNKIGAFVATIPLPSPSNESSTASAEAISQSLRRGKSSPAPLLSWILAKLFCDYTPDWFSKLMMQKFNAKAVAVVSNIKGWPFEVHWLGRKVAFLCAFLPLPPGIPIGIVIQSYDDKVTFSINADNRAVPDANAFAKWMLEEYHRIEKQGKKL